MTDHSKSLSFFSPAKINLFLRILSKRPDGYHTLASLMQAISLGDTLHITQSPFSHDTLTCTDSSLPCDASNLVLRAAELFRAKSGISIYVKVHLEKQIPMEAGLGGGSSNAATTLWALNQLSGFPFSTTLLQKWSAELGSDVPFFFSTGTAYCTSRGERVQSIAPLVLPSVWIVKPPQGLSTRTVYSALKLEQLSQRDPEISLSVFQSMAGHFPLYNDLEAIALRLDPQLKLLAEALRHQYGNQVLLSGSGSSFFCLGQQAPCLVHENGGHQYRVFSSKSLQRHENAWYKP